MFTAENAPHRRRGFLVSAVCLLAIAIQARAQSAPAGATGPQALLDKAIAHHNAYNERYQSLDYVHAAQEMNAAIRLYAQGTRDFPGNSAFNLGLGVYQNLTGQYAEGLKSLLRERKIIENFKQPSRRDLVLVDESMAESYEGLLQFDKAAEAYLRTAKGDPKDPEAPAAAARCQSLYESFRKFDAWIPTALAKVPDGTHVTVAYDSGPTTYPGYRRVNYSLTKKNGRAGLSVDISVFYAGRRANRQKVEQRLADILGLVEACYRRSGIDLHVRCQFVAKSEDLTACNSVSIWDHYRPADARMGDTLNWAILTARGLELTDKTAASTVAHEIGHMLGLPHPAWYPDKPYSDVMTAAHPWTPITYKRVFPDDVRLLLSQLVAPAGLQGLPARASALVAAGKKPQAIALLKRACSTWPQDRICKESLVSLQFDTGDYAGAAETYTDMIRLTPGDYTLYLLRGASLLRAKKYKEAVKDFTAVVSQHSGGLHDAAHFERAEAYEKLGLNAKAKADRDKIGKLPVAEKPEN
ncbi:MAG: tetratricopeptide repeat protein [Planctomycetaceae bacterium]|nr:tetratricopeptide repeat protein [Planctomycetaceae bacterium]